MKTKHASEIHYKKIGVDIGEGRYHEEMVYGIGLMYTSLYQQIDSCLKEYGQLKPEEMHVLLLVKHQQEGQGLSQVEIGRRLMVPAHNITRLLQRLEKQGFVNRSSHKEDNRVTIVRITPKGSQLLDKVWPVYEKKLQGMASTLTKEEQKIFAGLIQKWLSKETTAKKGELL